MPIKLRVGGVLREIKTIRMVIGGQLRPLKSIKVMIGGEWRLVHAASTGGGGGGFTLSVPPFASGGGQSSTITSAAITATPTGGVAPYTYAWTVETYTHPSIAPRFNSPTFATTTISQPSMSPGDEFEAFVRCTCTDSVGQTATGTCTVSFNRRAVISDL